MELPISGPRYERNDESVKSAPARDAQRERHDAASLGMIFDKRLIVEEEMKTGRGENDFVA